MVAFDGGGEAPAFGQDGARFFDEILFSPGREDRLEVLEVAGVVVLADGLEEDFLGGIWQGGVGQLFYSVSRRLLERREYGLDPSW